MDSPQQKFFVSDDGKEKLSITKAELQAGIDSGKHGEKTLAWTKGMSEWLPLADPFWEKHGIVIELLADWKMVFRNLSSDKKVQYLNFCDSIINSSVTNKLKELQNRKLALIDSEKEDNVTFPSSYLTLSQLRSANHSLDQVDNDLTNFFYSESKSLKEGRKFKKVKSELDLERTDDSQMALDLDGKSIDQNHSSTELNFFYIESYIPKSFTKGKSQGGFSNLLLKLKNKCPSAIETLLQFFLPINLENFALVAAPSSKPNEVSGIRMFAEALSKQSKCRVFSGLLKRTKSMEKRHLGAKRTLKEELSSIKLEAPEGLNQKDILLLDDICTTGTTMKACEIILRGAYPNKLINFAIGHTCTKKMHEVIGEVERSSQKSALIRCPRCNLLLEANRIPKIEISQGNNHACNFCNLSFYLNFHENGRLKEKGYFLGGDREGNWVELDQIGRTVAERNYKNGLQHGLQFSSGSYDNYDNGRWLGGV
jgi:hypothetical protein